MSLPRRMPPSSSTSTRPSDRGDDFRQHAQRRRDAVELTPAVVRHDDRVRARVDRPARIVGRVHALDDDRPLPGVADPARDRASDTIDCSSAAPTSAYGIGADPAARRWGTSSGRRRRGSPRASAAARGTAAANGSIGHESAASAAPSCRCGRRARAAGDRRVDGDDERRESGRARARDGRRARRRARRRGRADTRPDRVVAAFTSSRRQPESVERM